MGKHCLVTKEVQCGSDVREGSQGEVVFGQDADVEMETSGKCLLKKDVKVEQGARLLVRPSVIRY